MNNSFEPIDNPESTTIEQAMMPQQQRLMGDQIISWWKSAVAFLKHQPEVVDHEDIIFASIIEFMSKAGDWVTGKFGKARGTALDQPNNPQGPDLQP